MNTFSYIEDILKMISYFPRLVEEEKNEDLKEVPREELKELLKYFKKEKRRGPSEWKICVLWLPI